MWQLQQSVRYPRLGDDESYQLTINQTTSYPFKPTATFGALHGLNNPSATYLLTADTRSQAVSS